MRNTRLATRYARSLINLAQEKDALEGTLKDINYLQELCEKCPDFTQMMRSPVINSEKKLNIVEAVIKDNIMPIAKGFLILLIKKGREYFLPEMLAAFISQYKELKHIHDVKLSTVVVLPDELTEAIKAKIAASLGDGTVALQLHTDENLIGGFIIEAGDKLYDASIRGDLNEIKKQFTKNLYAVSV